MYGIYVVNVQYSSQFSSWEYPGNILGKSQIFRVRKCPSERDIWILTWKIFNFPEKYSQGIPSWKIYWNISCFMTYILNIFCMVFLEII
jgi:hypothetical protein